MRVLLLLALLLIYTGCDHGLEPPDAPPFGSIRGTVTYVGPLWWNRTITTFTNWTPRPPRVI